MVIALSPLLTQKVKNPHHYRVFDTSRKTPQKLVYRKNPNAVTSLREVSDLKHKP